MPASVASAKIYGSLSLTASVCFLFLSGAVLPAHSRTFTNSHKQGTSAEMHAEMGLQSVRDGNLQLAEAELRKAVALAPGNASFHSNLGTVLAMERALKIDPLDLGARRYLAANLWQLHRFVEAKQQLLFVLNVKPDDPQASLLLGMVSENTEDYAEAAKFLASVPALIREHPESTVALARAYYHIGEREKARLWLLELLKHPGGAPAILLGAQIADEMKDYQTAEILLLSLPNSIGESAIRYRLAVVKFHSKQFEESRQILQQLLDAGQKTTAILRLLGWCSQEQNRREEAVHAFQDAIRLDPVDETNYLGLGKILLAQHRFTAALELSKRTVGAFPDSASAFFQKGSVELAVDQFRDAIDSFTRSLQLDPASVDTTIGLARAKAGAGMTPQAKATLQDAIGKFSQKAPLELELAALFLKESETGKANSEARAEELLLSSATHDSTLAEPYYQLGDISLRHDRTAKALVYFEKAEKLDPESVKTHFALARTFRRLGRGEDAARQTEIYERLKEKEPQRAPVPSPTDSPGQ
jgi:tetratricopeptide (TPR) repeat protein